MIINNISKCRKPRCFTGQEVESSTVSANNGKKRYKHFEEMSNDVLMLKSARNAQRDMENSSKVKLKKAMPLIGTALIGTSLAITQPGKLSAKTMTGLGYLFVANGLSTIVNQVSKSVDDTYMLNELKHPEMSDDSKVQNQKLLSKIILTILAAAGAVGAGIGAVKAIQKGDGKAAKFIQKEAKQLANEINSTKISKFIEANIKPITKKHPKLTFVSKMMLPIGAFATAIFGDKKLKESISNDSREKTLDYFEKGKEIQNNARKHFDTIDAIEV